MVRTTITNLQTGKLQGTSTMTLIEKSAEVIPLSEVPDQSVPPHSALHRRIWRKIATVRWREMITASIIVLDLFLLYASILLIGVFFPAEVRISG